MKKTITIIAAAAILLIFIIGLTVLFYIQHTHENEAETDPLQKDAVLLEKLSADKSQKAFNRLLELGERKDAVGYYALVELGDRIWAQGKDPSSYYKRALDLYESKDVRKKLAGALARSGDSLEAAKAYASVLPDGDALRSLIGLGLGADTTAQVLLDNGAYQTAENYLKPEMDGAVDKDFKIKLQKLYARALAELGKYNDALSQIEVLKVNGPLDKNLTWWYARSLEALGQTGKARELYSSLGEMGSYRLGLLLEKEGKLFDAASAYLKSSDAESQWKGAHALDELGRHDSALKIYSSLSNIQSVYKDDAAYRVFVLTRRSTGKEDENMLSIISTHPSWMVRLNKEPVWPDTLQATYSVPEFLKRVDAYEKSSRGTMARVELSIGEKNAQQVEKLALGDWYLSRGDSYRAAVWGTKALNDGPDRHGYELAYQKPYEDQVRKSAVEFGVDQNLIWAVMRGESYFDPNGISGAGAMGLMQIMPDTGKYIASRLKVPYAQKDLLNPGINIRFGTYYLKSLIDMYSGDVDKALASYNGGSGNVNRWSKSGIGTTKEDFPTAVSFLETREYITKIQDSYYVYKRFYTDK